MRWVVTGGAGFIGSAFCRLALRHKWASEVVVLDALTYAGNIDNLSEVANEPGFSFVHGDITKLSDAERAIGTGCDAVFHFAAESHVDASIASASQFALTNVLGTQVLLDVARKRGVGRFVHVSTDEVYGSLALDTPDRFVESTPLNPTSPYSASKASSDLMVLAAARTHGLDAVITRCSNNYGPYQFPEKFIPLFITRALTNQSLPLYGDGKNIRDWIYVDDHCRGIYAAFTRGKSGCAYNLGGNCERSNRDIAARIIELCGADENLLTRVPDRLAHDRRYAIDPSCAKEELGFEPGPSIDERLGELIAWYKEYAQWWRRIESGAYRHAQQFLSRAKPANRSPALS